MTTAGPAGRARQGNGNAFGIRTGPYRRELHVPRCRTLDSAAGAGDALQETMPAAWPGIGGFGERASLRTWLYRIATRHRLNALRSASRSPVWGACIARTDPPGAARVSEAPWLEPHPGLLPDRVAGAGAGPEARYRRNEAISLAFTAALQFLPFGNGSLARLGLPRTVRA
jgi:DNA-directed RNA polymerase specialized sigma24 family protein